MTGARVTGLGRRAKYGLIHTDRGDTLIFHLAMSGRGRISPEAIGPHCHLLIETGSGILLSLNDPRRFGSLDLVPSSDLTAFPAFAAMGPEPLGPELSATYLLKALSGRAAPIKALLLDQRIVAGLGNIYVCEALHLSGLSPAAPAGRIRRARVERLVDDIRLVLDSARLAGGTSTRDFSQDLNNLVYFTIRQTSGRGKIGQ